MPEPKKKGILELIQEEAQERYRNSLLARLGPQVNLRETLQRVTRDYERLRLAGFPRPDRRECYEDIQALLIHPACDWSIANKKKLEEAGRIFMGIVEELKGQHQPPGCWKCSNMNLSKDMPRCWSAPQNLVQEIW